MTTRASGGQSTDDESPATTQRRIRSNTERTGRAVVQRRVLRDGVYDAILEVLLSGQVATGESLSIEGLARDFGVSATPVREALVQLEHTGLVTRAALKGYRVSAPLTRERTAELIDARAIVEVAAIRDAVPVTSEVLRQLETVCSQHGSAALRVHKMVERHPGRLDWATLRKYYTVDWEFHRIFLRNCHNSYLLEIAESLSPHIHRLRQTMNYGVIDVDDAVAEHAAILEAVRTGDSEAAAAAMSDHISSVRARALADF